MKGGGADTNLRAGIIIFVLKDRSAGVLVGKIEEVMIKLGLQYYDAADVSIDYEWAVVIAFASQACYLHHRLDICIIGLIALVHGKNG